jgi:hypothetical protein
VFAGELFVLRREIPAPGQLALGALIGEIHPRVPRGKRLFHFQDT